MKKNPKKGLLSVLLLSVLVTGCNARTDQTNTEQTAEETTIAENSDKEDEKETDRQRQQNMLTDTDANGNEQKKPKGNGDRNGARVGDIGRMNQKITLTETQQNVINKTKDKFEQFSYQDESNGVTLDYSLFVPTDYDESTTYPLIMFIPDSSAAGKTCNDILSQYFGADIWASEAEQEKHAAFVFCPAFSETVVDDDFHTSNQIDTAIKVLNELTEKYNIDTSRLYTTGQSMGCMTSLYLNGLYPDMFAASLFVSGQWDITTLQPLENARFFYITCTGDSKASGGQTEVMDLFDTDNVAYSFLEHMDPEETAEEKNRKIREMLNSRNNANFIRFDGLDHMSSFNYAYDLEAVRDWIFEQKK